MQIPGIPENTEKKDLENLTLQIFEKIDINVDLAKVEDCHGSKHSAQKKIIIKVSRRKDANKIRTEKVRT